MLPVRSRLAARAGLRRRGVRRRLRRASSVGQLATRARSDGGSLSRQGRRRGRERAGGRAAGLDRRLPGRQPRRHDRRTTRSAPAAAASSSSPAAPRTAARDSALADDELTGAQKRCGGPDNLVEIPVYISPIAIIYNLEGVDNLQLSPETLAKIFNQKIKNWNDPAIKADNPDAAAARPAHHGRQPLGRVGHDRELHRLPGQTAPRATGPHEVSGDWPVKGGEAAQGTSGVVDAVEAGKGAIGYADASQAGELGMAKIKVGDEFVAPTPEAAAKIVDESKETDDAGQVRVHVRPQPHDDGGRHVPDRPRLLRDGLHQVRRRRPGRARQGLPAATSISAEGQEAAAKNAGSAPITDAVRAEESSPAVDAIGGQLDATHRALERETSSAAASTTCEIREFDEPGPSPARRARRRSRLRGRRDRRGRAHPGHVLAGVALFLIVKAWPAITADRRRSPGGEGLVKYIWPLAFGTLVAATIAIVVAVPLAVAVALFISHIAPRADRAADELRDRPARGDPERHLRPLGHRRPRPGLGRRCSSGWRDNLGWIPFFEGPASRDRPHDAGRRPRAGGDDPADHHRRHALGLRRRRRGACRRARWRSAPRAGR